jgi:FKBP-type peptidyl-prolyl cis-trans isomerase FklB
MRLLAVVFAMVMLAGSACAEEKIELKDERDKVSYSIGTDIGQNLKRQSLDINTDALAKGISDAYTGGQAMMTDDEIRDTMATFRKEMMAKQQEMMKSLGEKNKVEGAAFLSENEKKEGVKTLPSGLQYKVIKEGDGAIPSATDKVSVHYKGTLIDGTEFDSSYGRGQPASFPVNGVIKGWTEALQLMKTGSKWNLYIPSELAYGERGAGGKIGPNATLIFEVELLSIEK